MMTKIALASVLALALAAPAGARSPLEPGQTPAEKPARQCFFARDVNSFAAASETIVNLRVGVRDYYQLEMFGRCPDVDWANRVGLVSRNTSTICTGMDAEIIVAESGIGPQRCLVRNVRKLTPEEVAALSGKAKP